MKERPLFSIVLCILIIVLCVACGSDNESAPENLLPPIEVTPENPLASIEVTPTNSAIILGNSYQFTATGTFSDNTIRDITAEVTWGTGDEGIATVSNVSGSEGLATSISTGTVIITATDPGGTLSDGGELSITAFPDSGQIACYDTTGTIKDCIGTGQDGAYVINPMMLIDNGDGTVYDQVTGLTWQRCSSGLNNDSTCTGTATTYNWYEATGTYHVSSNPGSIDVCGSLNLAGGGWRLPSDMELISIIDYGNFGPAIDGTLFPSTMATFYWPATRYITNGYAWRIDFNKGGINYAVLEQGNYVRCVR